MGNEGSKEAGGGGGAASPTKDAKKGGANNSTNSTSAANNTTSTKLKGIGGNVPLDGGANDAAGGGAGMFEMSANRPQTNNSGTAASPTTAIPPDVAMGTHFVVRPEIIAQQQQQMYANAPVPHPCTTTHQLPAVHQMSGNGTPTAPPMMPPTNSGSSTANSTRQPVRLDQQGIAQTALNFTQPPLGKGGFSVVHQGRFYKEDVAVKVLTIRNPQEHAMFVEELRAMLNPTLWHANICPLIAYCDTAPAFVFPRLTALNVPRMARLPDDVKDTICVDVAMGLAHMHRAGYVHMDMKPDNVLLLFDDQRRIQKGLVGDLGCAKAMSAPVLPFGTIVFLDPQLRFDVPKNPHPADDVFSLGITFLCMWTNRIPAAREEIPTMMGLLQAADPFRYTMVAAMTCSNPNQRPTCQYVADVLRGRQGYMWGKQLYPWSAGRVPLVTQPPFIGEAGHQQQYQIQQQQQHQQQQAPPQQQLARGVPTTVVQQHQSPPPQGLQQQVHAGTPQQQQRPQPKGNSNV